MQTIKYWLVEPESRRTTELKNVTTRTALRVFNGMKQIIPGLCLCTNECATTFENGITFSNGKFI